MPERLVLDASAALAILRAETAGAECARILATASAEGSILVPDHFWLELGNVLARRYGWDPDAVVVAFQALDELGIETAAIERPLVLLSLDLMAAHLLTAYDAAYLALAEIEDAGLLTLDRDLAMAADDRAVVPDRGVLAKGAPRMCTRRRRRRRGRRTPATSPSSAGAPRARRSCEVAVAYRGSKNDLGHRQRATRRGGPPRG